MGRGVLAVIIPLLAVIMVAGIGIPIGLLFVWTDDVWNADVTLVVAVALTAVIMIVATLLSISASRRSEPAVVHRPVASDRPDRIVEPDRGE